jgi:hypothetical protein
MKNPYASHLGNRDPLQVIAATASQLDQLFGTLGPQGVEQSPAPGKWSAREIVCHLADCELVFAARLRQTLAEDHHVIQPFDQEKWAATYAAYAASAALVVFASTRQWNLTFISAVPQGTFSKQVFHPERGEMTFRTLLETMAGHDINHLRQIEKIAGISSAV